MRMIAAGIGMVASITLAGTAGAQTPLPPLADSSNHLVNGSFWTGDFTGWTITTSNVLGWTGLAPCPNTGSLSIASPGYDDNFAASFGGMTCIVQLSQTYASVPGHVYTISLWAQFIGAAPGQTLPANDNFGVATKYCGQTENAVGWQAYRSCIQIATDTTTTFVLSAYNASGTMEVDDISVIDMTRVPEPSSLALLATGLVPLIPVVRRGRVRG